MSSFYYSSNGGSGAGLIVTIVLLFLFFGGRWMCNDYFCSTKAEAMSLSYSYGPVQGCMVKSKDGQWVPLNAYRVID